MHAINWDCIIFDEYHYGAWREKSKGLFEAEEQAFQKQLEAEAEMDMICPIILMKKPCRLPAITF